MDDLSSQGSYMVKIGKQHSEAEGGFSDMQSQGSYMVRGFNGQIGNRPIFDDDSDGSFIRQSDSSFIQQEEHSSRRGTQMSLRKSQVKDEIPEQEEEEDTTAKFTS